MWKFILYIFLGYFLYRFITGFLIPVFKTGKQIRRQFNDMQQRMQDQMNQQQQPPFSPQTKDQGKTTAGDYIDFEEVK
ncbi:MAG: hypothetical protein QM802_14655 [Agriterribacter sp.]